MIMRRTSSTPQVVALAAHGSGDGSYANQRLAELSDALRSLRPGMDFRWAVWRGRPGMEEVAANLAGRSPIVVPVMASAGYYARRVLPAQWKRGDATLSFRITPSISELRTFSSVVMRNVKEALLEMGARGMAPVVVLVGHGTTRVRSSGNVARRLQGALTRAFPGTTVLTAFLDEPPYLQDVAELLRDRPVIAAPLLMGGGPHLRLDFEKTLVRARTDPEAQSEASLEMLPAILEWPELPSLVLEMVDLAPRILTGRSQ